MRYWSSGKTVPTTKRASTSRTRLTRVTHRMSSLDPIVKAYDIRGTVPEPLDSSMCRAFGAAFARFTGASRVLVARDMRPSGVELSRAFADGVRSQGVDVLNIGLASTDMLYYAAGRFDSPGAMFTASHNPAKYNGIKLCG